MGKNLVVVESPSKAKTIEKYLGRQFKVLASYGHIKDLPERDLGIDMDKGFEPRYELSSKSKKYVTAIKDAAKDADTVYIASDPDREGEAIAFHVAEELSRLKKPVRRVLFFEVTKAAIEKAFEHPIELDEKKYNAQKSRRVLDRLVGYKISPILWQKVKNGLSAGRVQSVALKLICDREKEIKAFVPVEFWDIRGAFDAGGDARIEAKLEEAGGRKVKIADKAQAEAILERIRTRSYFLAARTERPRKRSAPIPFITSTLQQEAVRRLRFTTKRTMVVAQGLYEGIELGDLGRQGVITYMRTDSPRISDDALKAVRTHITAAYGTEFLSDKPRQFSGKGSAQEAHECIRPTSTDLTPDSIRQYLSPEQYNLYKMIFDRFVASQMKDALFSQTVYDIKDREAGEFTFRARGLTLKFAGYLKAYMDSRDDSKDEKDDTEGEGRTLPPVEPETALGLAEVKGDQRFTSPPPRFTEATLVKELEEDGIGRPSTYASIIATLLDKDYARLVEGKFHPTDIGMTVVDLLVKGFPDIINEAFTARMEQTLDQVEEGTADWSREIAAFYDIFKKDLDSAATTMENLRKKGIETDIPCEKCGRPMVIKHWKGSEFLGCSGYPDCKNTKNFDRDRTGKIVLMATETDKTCPKCGKPLAVKKGRFGVFLACTGYPDCKHTEPVTLGVPCPREGCTGQIVERKSQKGKIFYGCTKYPECNVIMSQKPVAEKCPQCGSPYLVETVEKRTPVIKCPNKDCGYKRMR